MYCTTNIHSCNFLLQCVGCNWISGFRIPCLKLQAPVKLTTLRRFKLTSVGRCKLTTIGRSKLTT